MRKDPMIGTIEQWCQEHEKQVSPVAIFYAVLKVFDVTCGQICGGSRIAKYVEARRCFTWFMTRLKAGTLRDIADWMNIADHTTIIHHRDRKTDLLLIGDNIATTNIINVFNKLKQLQNHERV